ncbi:AAA ATPase domain-containing protein [Cavenderia fasciculata]|uniref:AAA ATPase domain-containing protein n=1 Tax=Cavenderia fasciculata TaxID=261658 RepID=F4PMJ2_CACFS|nr:AAA ATPase domain-containing protein [Cavenderia fasciculata]EGG23639.1 AAA ATPase domain-containing protein [Cavenderia fasciculata]|eukprot:XP_004361490.1 AAA ATPase domain-containing protein [Cavenderia fasciculata]
MISSLTSSVNFRKNRETLFGKPAHHRILVIGETGSGKSTFINTVGNYFTNGKCSNPNVFIPTTNLQQNQMMNIKHTENLDSCSTESQTTRCSTYTFEKGNSYYYFIDSPGFNDTAGKEKDQENIMHILATIMAEETITCIIIVINGTQIRMTEQLRYVIDCFKGNLPADLFDNILVVFTKCAEGESSFRISELDIPGVEDDGRSYCMNNSGFGPTLYNQCKPEYQKARSNSWHDSMKTIDDLIGVIHALNIKPATSFKKIHKKRMRITEDIHNLVLKMLSLNDINDKLKKSSLSFNDDLDVQVERYEFEDSPNLNLLCSTCNKSCKVCSFNTPIISLCSNINLVSGTCKSCACSSKVHYHSHKEIVLVKRTIRYLLEHRETNEIVITKKLTKILKPTEEADKKISSASNKSKEINDKKSLLEANMQEKATLIDDLVAMITKFKKLCPGLNHVREMQEMVDLLAKKYNESGHKTYQATPLEFDTVIREIQEDLIGKLKTLFSVDQINYK